MDVLAVVITFAVVFVGMFIIAKMPERKSK